jgi:hypothetical protein
MRWHDVVRDASLCSTKRKMVVTHEIIMSFIDVNFDTW